MVARAPSFARARVRDHSIARAASILDAMHARWSSSAIAALLVVSSSACSSYPHVHLEPALLSAELRAEDDAPRAHVLVAWRGFGEHGGVPELRFRVRVEDPGPEPFALAPAEFELLDGQGRSLGVARGVELPAAVEAGRPLRFELAFPAPPGRDLASFDLDELTLRVRLQGGRWAWDAVFEHDYRSEDPVWD